MDHSSGILAKLRALVKEELLGHNKKMENKAAFFDRDGTLIVDKHYMHDPKEIEYFDDTLATLKSLQDRGYLLFIVTNQSGIGRGLFTVEQMHLVHDQMLDDFANAGIHITDIAFCPHAPEENCLCRKPHPKMLLDLCQKYQVAPEKSFMIGDKMIDAECGENAGMTGILLEEDDSLTQVLLLMG